MPYPRKTMLGMSLLEMMLVLTLVATVGLLSAMAMNGGLKSMQMRSAGKSLAAELRYTRTRAIATGAPQQFELDLRNRRWQGANGRQGTLQGSFSLNFTGSHPAQASTDTATVRFFEDGASSGGRIELGSGEAVWRIDIGWITGEIRSGLRSDGQ